MIRHTDAQIVGIDTHIDIENVAECDGCNFERQLVMVAFTIRFASTDAMDRMLDGTSVTALHASYWLCGSCTAVLYGVPPNTAPSRWRRFTLGTCAHGWFRRSCRRHWYARIMPH